MTAEASRESGTLDPRVDVLLHNIDDLRQEMRAGFSRLETSLSTRLNTHAARLATLERWKSFINGAQWLLGLLWVALLAWLGVRGARGE